MINFHKYHGAGNDFIMINNLDGDIHLKSEHIKTLCDRHFGIGADGLILLQSSEKADCFMNYYNSDGSLAEMCGNGARCTAKFFLDQTDSHAKELSIDTKAGIKKIICKSDDTYSVNMGAPIFEHTDFPSGLLNIEGLPFECVSMGNPHAVMIKDTLDNFDILSIGPEIENDYHFPNKINVEFVEKIKDDYFKVKVWERGCGPTLACGTGACAAFSILNKKENFKKEITLEFPGGKLFLSENHRGEIILRGPATFVFKGEI
ncbi:MAG TPA: diaminopimelate epimerase [Candidatus Paceibacterota bacterium]